MALKPPVDLPQLAVRNGATPPAKRAHSAIVKNQSMPQSGGNTPTVPYICNESVAPARMGKKKKK